MSVETVGADRIAHCEQSIDATIVQAPDPSAPPMRFATTSATMRDSRHVQINLDRGIVQSSQMELTFDSTETPADAAYPTSKRHGVIKATVTGTY